MTKYIHGSGDRSIEEKRLLTQANLMRPHLWKDIDLKKMLNNFNEPFLEVGCGVGAQTIDLINKLPKTINLISIDNDPAQIKKAKNHIAKTQDLQTRCNFLVQDVTDLPYANNSLSGAYICWVLEHMTHEMILKTLSELKRVIKKNGIIIINETDARPKKSVIFREKKRDVFPPTTLKFFKAMLAEQEAMGCNGAFGGRENILHYMALAEFNNFSYKRIIIHIKEGTPEKTAITDGTIKLLYSTLPCLVRSGSFLADEFDIVKQEVADSPFFHWEGSQIICKNVA